MKNIKPAISAIIITCSFYFIGLTALAQNYDLDTSLNNYGAPPELNKPNYLQTVIDPLFDTKITRITGNVGTSIANVNGTWQDIARHGYSARQPWNADESLIYLDRHIGGPDLFLNGETYEVIKEANIPSGNEHRWHSTDPDLFLILRDDGIYSWSYSTEALTKLIDINGYSNTSLGYTGNYSMDGNVLAMFATRNSDGQEVAFGVDISSQTKFPDVDLTGWNSIDYTTTSPLGTYIVVNGTFSGNNDVTKIYVMSTGNQTGPLWSNYGRPSHYDVTLFEGVEYVIGNSKSSPDDGRIIRRRMSDGEVTVLTQGGYGSHGSARSIKRQGWVFTQMSDSPSWGPYYDEIVGVSSSGDRVERIVSIRGSWSDYENQPHAVPSPSGSRVLFASDWNNNAPPVQTYIADFRHKLIGGGGSNNVNAGEDKDICYGDTVTLTATGAQSYIWSTGETTSSITVTLYDTTTFTVTGTASNGDTSTDSVVVNVNSIPVANAGVDVVICQGEDATLTASGGDSYLWSNGATTQSITISPNDTTNYSVIVTQNSCSSTDEVTVTVKPRQTINAGNDVDIYLGESTTLTVIGEGDILWSTGETTSSITVTPTYTTTYSVEATELNGCTAYDEVTVTVIGTVAPNAGSDVIICNGETATLTASGGETYLWSTGETTATIVVNPNSTTTYSVEVSNAISTGYDDATVFVNDIPNVDAGEDQTINLGQYITLSATGAETYLWSNGATQPNIAVSPQQTTDYFVTGFTNNCSNVAQVKVTVNNTNMVNANAGKDQIICMGESVRLTASGGDDYLWNTGETSRIIDVSPDEDTLYTVVVSNQFGSDSDDVLVEVIQCEEEETDPNYHYDIYPNPTNDGKLRLHLGGLSNNSNIFIHDAIGKLIHFETINDNNGLIFQKEIDISRFKTGLYFVTLEELEKSTTKKVVFR